MFLCAHVFIWALQRLRFFFFKACIFMQMRGRYCSPCLDPVHCDCAISLQSRIRGKWERAEMFSSGLFMTDWNTLCCALLSESFSLSSPPLCKQNPTYFYTSNNSSSVYTTADWTVRLEKQCFFCLFLHTWFKEKRKKATGADYQPSGLAAGTRELSHTCWVAVAFLKDLQHPDTSVEQSSSCLFGRRLLRLPVKTVDSISSRRRPAGLQRNGRIRP